MGVSDFISNIGLFRDWKPGAVVAWLILTGFIITVSWFIKIPSAAGGPGGFPRLYSIVFTVILPAVTYWFLDDPTRTEMFKRGKR